MFSQEEINAALKRYHQCGSVTKTIRVLGCPTRRTMYWWIEYAESVDVVSDGNRAVQ